MKKIQAAILVTPILSAVLLLHVNYLRFVCDDAFISFRYAKNFIQGHGLVYNFGERVEGYTNFLWTLLLSLFMKVGFDPVLVSQVLGMVFGLGTLFLLLRLNKKLYPEENLFNYLAPLFLVSCGAFAAWCTGGLETSFYTFLVFLGTFLFVIGLNNPRLLTFSGIAFALACMTRLDGLIFAGVTFLFLCYLTFVGKRIDPRSLLVWSLTFCLLFLAYFVWRWYYYGMLLPNTFYVKLGGGNFLGQGFFYLFDFVRRFWIWLAVIPLSFLIWAARLPARTKVVASYFTSLTLAFSCYVVCVGGDFMDMFRFLVPILPFLFFLIQEGFRGIYGHFQSVSLPGTRRVFVTSSLALLAGLMVFSLARPSMESNKLWSRSGIDSIGMLRETAREWSMVGMMFKAMADSDESLATTAAGAIPYYSELYAFDQLGLTFPTHSQLKDRNVTKAGHTRRIKDEYLLFLRPTYVLEHPKIRDDYRQTRGVWLSGDLLLRNGYKAVVFPVSMSESETKFLYCFSLKESRSQRVEDSRFRVEEAKDGE